MEQHIKCIAVTNQAEEKYQFALQELLALLELFGLKYSFENIKKDNLWEYQPQTFKYYPFMIIYLPSTKVFEELLSRAVYVNQLMIFLSQGSTLQELANNVIENPYIKDPNLNARIEFLTSYGKWFQQNEKVEMIDKFTDMLDMKNGVDLNKPDITYYICAYETYQKPQKKNAKQQEEFKKEQYYYLGIQLGGKLRRRDKTFVKNFQLTDRIYLGPVTLAHELSFLMANQALVKEGDYVLDPFAGTGSNLVACSYFGGICFGSELDKHLIQGFCIGQLNKKSSYYKEELVKQRPYVNHNFSQYKLPIPDYVAMDINLDCWKCEGFFDAIVTDPPYGIRASIGSQDGKDESKRSIYQRLLEVARKILKKGGRLVFLEPVRRDSYEGLKKDYAEGYTLIDFREQILADQRSRILVTLEKQ